MFCRNCGKKLDEGARFCNGCGCSVSDAAAPIVPSCKSRNKKRTLIVMGVVAVLLVGGIVLGAGLLKSSINTAPESGAMEGFGFEQMEDHQAEEATSVHNVKFEDFLVERCVREALGKGWDEDVTEEELSSMRKLTLSWEKDITLGLDFVSFNRAYSGYVNLADLKYLTGLEELQLDFYPKSTVLENMDVIVNCGKLRSLSMPLLLRGYNYANGYMGKGYHYLKDIFAQLPVLEKVDFGVAVPGQLQELLQPGESEREIVFTKGEENNFDWGMIWTDICYGPNENIMTERGISVISLEELMHMAEMKKGAERGKYEEASLQLEDVVILVGKGESFDCEMLADFKNIKTLAIFGKSPVAIQSPTSQVIHLEALAEIPDLGSLSLYNVETDLAGLAEYSNLRELYLTFCNNKETFGLQRLPLLRELSIVGISDEKGIHVSWPKLWENMPELRYFNGYFVGVDSGSIPDIFADGKGMAKLENLVLGCAGSNGAEFMGDILAQMPEELALKTIFLNILGGTIDLEQVKCNDSLESFFCSSQAEHVAEFINTHPNLVAVTVMGIPKMPDEDSLAAYYNDIIKAAVKDPNLSMLDMWRWMGSTFSGDAAYLNNVRGFVDLMSLYKAGIYDDTLQKGAFIRDMDIEDYHDGEWVLR